MDTRTLDKVVRSGRSCEEDELVVSIKEPGGQNAPRKGKGREKGRLQRGELLGQGIRLDGRTRNATVDDDTVERMRDSFKGRFYVQRQSGGCPAEACLV